MHPIITRKIRRALPLIKVLSIKSEVYLWLHYLSYNMSRWVRKRIVGYVCPANIQISLCIRTVWSESLLGSVWIANDKKLLHGDNNDSDQNVGMRRLHGVFVGCICQKTSSLKSWFSLLYVDNVHGNFYFHVLSLRLFWKHAWFIYMGLR